MCLNVSQWFLLVRMFSVVLYGCHGFSKVLVCSHRLSMVLIGSRRFLISVC